MPHPITAKIYITLSALACVVLGLLVDRHLNPELANPYVLPVFDAIYPYLLPLVVISAIATLLARSRATARGFHAAQMILMGSLTLLALYLAMCLRLYPK